MTAPKDTKQRLIDTALELIWRSSYGTVSVDDICKTANVKKGSFYHFFPSKIDLGVAAMEESFAGFQAKYDQIFSPSRPGIERFSLMVDYVYQSQVEVAEKYGHVCGCPCASVGSELAGQEDRVRQKFDELMRRKERYYANCLRDMVAEGVIEPPVSADELAKEVSAYILGQLMLARIQNDLSGLQRELKPGLFRLIRVKDASLTQAA